MSTDCPARYGAQLTLPVRTRRAAGNGKLIRFEDLGARLVASYPDFILFYFILFLLTRDENIMLTCGELAVLAHRPETCRCVQQCQCQ